MNVLARRTKKITKQAKKLRELDPQQRHKLRIAVKKLRYASIFLDTFSPARRRRSACPLSKACLTDLQDHLGALTDITVHQKLAPKLAAGTSQTKARALAFAAGIVSGHEQSEVEPLLDAADKDARKFARLRPFWN